MPLPKDFDLQCFDVFDITAKDIDFTNKDISFKIEPDEYFDVRSEKDPRDPKGKTYKALIKTKKIVDLKTKYAMKLISTVSIFKIFCCCSNTH